MKRVVMKVFEKQVIDLDGNVFLSCVFDDCVLQFSGGITVLDACTVRTTKLRFVGNAHNTIELLKSFLRDQEGDKPTFTSLLSLVGLSTAEVIREGTDNGSV